jgi:hypothetical protein
MVVQCGWSAGTSEKPGGVLLIGKPRMETGGRRHCHHQFLTPDIGNPHLGKQLAAVLSHAGMCQQGREPLAKSALVAPHGG